MTLKTWRIIDLINWTESYFKEKGFENPRSEIEWLLRSVLDCSRMDVYLRFEEPLSKTQLATLRDWVKRRLEREPLQYITGSCDFYGREFSVNKNVLIPRPETERLIDIALDKMKEIDSPNILDVGTGSGCIATTLGFELSYSTIFGIDVSADALDIANKNKENLNAKNVSFKEMDILEQVPEGQFDLLVSNPPYIPKNEMNELMKDVQAFEPSVALTDQKDGLTFYKRFAKIGKEVVKSGGWMILEVGLGEHPNAVRNIFIESGYPNTELLKDYNDDDRVLVISI
ncbi:MAG: peptide chain release factor N(5)-glutamine methyltransferase [Candidatus Marinimicrobia bacterium]|jgi:release factor glutamine methyltransferase|nr:peptide chain release factor N(5)-glutamine methyltransferase [Candidatus Neomarinimicrobiota bacterium]|tara:strand:- start:11183 stop:12040 length:858 start_codon:yes stop_codon:yes gene_type:complete